MDTMKSEDGQKPPVSSFQSVKDYVSTLVDTITSTPGFSKSLQSENKGKRYCADARGSKEENTERLVPNSDISRMMTPCDFTHIT